MQWNPWEREGIEYFNLGDLWSSYGEWSAYGTGARLNLNGRDSVVQYYVPYLSAIQIFTKTRDVLTDNIKMESRNGNMWTENDYFLEGCRMGQASPSNRSGNLYFQFFERSSPYQRVPLADKINGFMEKFPGLMTLRSIDLLAPSWMSIAWYPIYHIPTIKTLTDLSACFLSYHTLSSTFLDVDSDDQTGLTQRKGNKKGAVTLPPFGLATYKMRGGDIWFSDQTGSDRDSFIHLHCAADSWLRQLQVQQHDFNFFREGRNR